jgi:dihydrofolate reductase
MDVEANRRQAVRDASFLIAAVADNGVIGADGTIPWRLSSDMVHFRQSTLGCALVVGRRTFDSLPKAMPGRTLVVVTSRPLPEGANALSAASFDEAVRIAVEDTGSHAVAFAGGTSIYEAALALPWVRRALLTRVAIAPEGDASFPEMGPDWKSVRRDPLTSKDGEPGAFVDVLERPAQSA